MEYEKSPVGFGNDQYLKIKMYVDDEFIKTLDVPAIGFEEYIHSIAEKPLMRVLGDRSVKRTEITTEEFRVYT